MTSELPPIESWTVAEVAAMLRLSREYVGKRAAAGEWPHRRYGRRVVFLREDLEAIKAIGVAASPTGPARSITGMRRRRTADR